ncbi:MAG: NADH-quinone oxidoreductase subunit I [Actinobacteria bacterium]|nr:NADH-quinone oxidoreductase subunit I [Actinomycetota bacterium]
MPLGSGILKGLLTVLQVGVRKPATVMYPEQIRDIAYRFRGQVGMRRDELTGGMTCVGCGLCETACPNDVIRVDTSERADGTRKVDRYLFDVGRCVFCYFCIEACPVDALQRTHDFHLVTEDRRGLVITGEKMIEIWEHDLANRAREEQNLGPGVKMADWFERG